MTVVVDTGRITGTPYWRLFIRIAFLLVLAAVVWLGILQTIYFREPDRVRLACGSIDAIKDELINMIWNGMEVPDSLEEIVLRIRERPEYGRPTMDVVDPWGSRYFFEAAPDREFCGENCFRVTVRSFGRNRRDDHGGGDDIQVHVSAYPPDD